MNEETERTAQTGEPECPECGSAHVRFRLQHTGVSHRPLQERSLLWECRQCAAHWSERLFALADGGAAARAPGALTRPRA
jgi:DNA-directed RNA polymerase subunit M/transcription elongation factor TFIIS